VSAGRVKSNLLDNAPVAGLKSPAKLPRKAGAAFDVCFAREADEN
jgi:hypothetical protein